MYVKSFIHIPIHFICKYVYSYLFFSHVFCSTSNMLYVLFKIMINKNRNDIAQAANPSICFR